MANIAVLDIGKTNKKVFIYDQEFRLLDQSFASFPADETGPVHLERIEEHCDWFLGRLRKLSQLFDIQVISVTTHGATWVGVGEGASLALPVIAYSTEPGDDFRRVFSEKYGDASELYRQLSTPNFGALVCLGRGIAFARDHFPEKFRDIRSILCFPQYFGFLLTGRTVAECTYVGCHTYLWNFATRKWSFMVDLMGIRDLLPTRVGRPADVLGTISGEIASVTGLARQTLVTYGIHDSNASLLPFLLRENSPFVLVSTGTWCVAMVPTKDTFLTDEERGRNAFLNCDAFGNPVKTTLFMGGAEHDTWWGAIQQATGATDYPPCDMQLTASILEEADTFIFPGVMPGSGPFPKSVSRLWAKGKEVTLQNILNRREFPSELANPARLYVVLNIGLAIQTSEQLRGVGVTDGMPIFVEGGFRLNETYCLLLASLFPGSRVMRTNLTEATALGAALIGASALKHCDLRSLRDSFQIDSVPVEHRPLPQALRYRDAYLGQIMKEANHKP